MNWEEFFENVDCESCQNNDCCTIRRDVTQRMNEKGESFEDACCFEMEATCIIKEVI